MRRLALSVLTACGLAVIAGCAGGTGLSTGSNSSTIPTQVYFTGSGGMLNDIFVSPLNTAPTLPSQAVEVTANAQTGTGITVGVEPNATYTWAARFTSASDPASVNTYNVGASPNGNPGGTTKSCTNSANTPAVPLYYLPTTGSQRLAALPSGVQTSQVYVAPVAGVTAPYCLVLQATAFPGNVIGSITVVVSNSP